MVQDTNMGKKNRILIQLKRQTYCILKASSFAKLDIISPYSLYFDDYSLRLIRKKQF